MKKHIFAKMLFLIICLMFFSTLYAQLWMPAVFSERMILQQNINTAIWGKASPNREVLVITGWNNKTYRTNALLDGTWRVKVETPAASFNEYVLSIHSGDEMIEFKRVLIGEVWLCSGQSNMAMRMKGFHNQPVNNSLQDIISSSNEYLMCYDMERVSSVEPKKDTKGKWLVASPNTTAEFTATGYYFGRLLQQTLKVPVGLLHCSWGASHIEAWMSADAIAKFSSYTLPKTEADNKIRNKTPTVIYNGMLESILGYGFRGVIWYQGESNRLDYKNYPDLFKAMHTDWIAKWDVGVFPIYFCQIAPYDYGDANSAFMREAQLKIAQKQSNTEMAVLTDVGEENCIHPAQKKEVGERLAFIALRNSYGLAFAHKSPEYKSMAVSNGIATLTFNNVSDGLSTFGNELSGFEVAGEDKKFYPANAVIVKKAIEVRSKEVPVPVAVRYGFKNYFKGYLFGTNGLPVSSFRTDEWDDEH